MNTLIEPRHIKLFLDTIHGQPKEKQTTILEPIQSMITLSLLSYYPKGSKLSIYKNNLLINEPSFSQGIVRWYNQDSKEDIYLLFSIIKRFLMYHTMTDHTCYGVLRSKAIDGIQCLIDTYEYSDRDAVIQTLRHYQFILENYQVFQNSDLMENSPREQVFKTINTIYEDGFYDFVEACFRYIDHESNTENRKCYVNTLQEFMKPKHDRIHKWIQENLVYT